ncbi:MAG: glycoside hydrolase family 44 protein, partial [Actinomycetota bacterium]
MEPPTTLVTPSRPGPGPVRRPWRLATIVALLTIAAGLVAVSDSVQAAQSELIYDDAIGHGFQDWSWGNVDAASDAEVHRGSAAIAADLGPWEGVYLARPNPTGLNPEAVLEFWLHGGDGPADPIEVALVDGAHQAGTTVVITPTPGQWTNHRIPVADFGLADRLGGVWWMNATGSTRPTIHLDDVGFTGGSDLPREPDDAAGPALTVDLTPRTMTRTVTDPASGVSSDVTVSFPHPISDGVYGLNFAAPSLLDELDPGINRWGGNAVERYNHLNGITNLGKDWFFMNSPGEVGNDHRFETDNQAAGADTLLTIPATGWVSSDDAARCGYPLDAYAPMDVSEPHFLDRSLVCGNGQRGGQTVFGQPERTSIAVGPDHTTEWVRDLVATHGPAADGGVEIYAV